MGWNNPDGCLFLYPEDWDILNLSLHGAPKYVVLVSEEEPVTIDVTKYGGWGGIQGFAGLTGFAGIQGFTGSPGYSGTSSSEITGPVLWTFHDRELKKPFLVIWWERFYLRGKLYLMRYRKPGHGDGSWGYP